MVRSDGIEVRPAQADELGQIGALLAERGEPEDAVDMELVASDADEGLSSVLVAVEGDQVVSTATLLRETLSIDGVALPAGQVEMVATKPFYEGRGLVRDLMNLAHDRSRERGAVLQVMIGIPYFYRLFGYVYSLPIPSARALAMAPQSDPSISVRRAEVADIAAMNALQSAEQNPIDVTMPHSAGCWRWLVARDGSDQLVAERDGQVIATGRATPPDEGVVLGEIAGDSAGVLALVGHCARLGAEDTSVMERPRTSVQQVIEPLLKPLELREALQESYYVRVERLPVMLDALRPVLSQRWIVAGGEDRDILISSFGEHVRFHIGPDGMSPVSAGGALQAPVSAGGSGVPPDAFPPMLFGPDGALGLERHHPDMMLGSQREAMGILFPPQTSDLLTYYLPV